MTTKPDHKDIKKSPAPTHPGMMGDGTEEQNLGQPGNPAARIKKGRGRRRLCQGRQEGRMKITK